MAGYSNNRKIKECVLTFRSLSRATPASNVSLPSSSTVTAASFDNVKPEAKGCPELLEGKSKETFFKRRIQQNKEKLKTDISTNLTESSYLMCTLLMVTLRLPITVDIKLYNHEFPPGT
jgi:hypothetical protein